MNRFHGTVSGITLMIAVWALVLAMKGQGALRSGMDAWKANMQELGERRDEEMEIGEWMRPLQLHANKLWFAGKHANWALARFQLEEITELMSEIAEHQDIVEGTVNIGGLMEAVRNTQVDAIKQAVDRQSVDAFAAAYDDLLNACNTCHRSSNHPYIRIQRPTTPAFTNQAYEPLPGTVQAQ